MELFLLRSCLSLCKINHLIRTVASARIQDKLSRFNLGLQQSLETILHSSLSDLSWKQTMLSIQLSGLGLQEEARTSPAAIIGSCNASRSLVSRLLRLLNESLASYELNFPGESAELNNLCCLFPSCKGSFHNIQLYGISSRTMPICVTAHA